MERSRDMAEYGRVGIPRESQGEAIDKGAVTAETPAFRDTTTMRWWPMTVADEEWIYKAAWMCCGRKSWIGAAQTHWSPEDRDSQNWDSEIDTVPPWVCFALLCADPLDLLSWSENAFNVRCDDRSPQSGDFGCFTDDLNFERAGWFKGAEL